MAKVTVSGSEFAKYVGVQESGVTNMFAVTTVMKLSGLSREKVMFIMDNYTELNDKYEA